MTSPMVFDGLPIAVVFAWSASANRLERVYPEDSTLLNSMRLDLQGAYLVRVSWDGPVPLALETKTWAAGKAGASWSKKVPGLPAVSSGAAPAVMSFDTASEGRLPGCAPTFIYPTCSTNPGAAARCIITAYPIPTS